MKKYILLLALAATVVSWVLVTPVLAVKTALRVDTYVVRASTVKSTVDCTGTVQSNDTCTVSYGFAVKPLKVYVKVGDSVKAGQKLMEINKTESLQALQYVQAQQSASSSDSSSADGSVAASAQQSGDTVESSDVPSAVYSSISGVITQLSAQSGSFTTPGTTFVTVQNTASLQVLAQVDQNLINGVKAGQSAAVSSSGFSGTRSGAVTQVYPAADIVSTATGTKNVVDVLIRLSGADAAVKPGMSVSVSILKSENSKGICVPYEAVQQNSQNQEYVFVVQNGKAVMRTVKTGDELDDSVEVTAGLKSGESVILNPSDSLVSGQAVRAVSKNAEASHGGGNA